MNKLSGYTSYTLKSGRFVEFKICNGTYHLYARLMGFRTHEEAALSLVPPKKEAIDEEGKTVLIDDINTDYVDRIYKFIFCAAQYAALAQNKPVDFTEFDIWEWLEEVSTEAILNSMETLPDSVIGDSKKKSKKKPPLIRPTQ